MSANNPDPLPSSFIDFADGLTPPSALRAQITAAYRRPEPEALPPLLEQARLPAKPKKRTPSPTASPSSCATARTPPAAPASCKACCRNTRSPRKKASR
jgi:hypothetical protein